MQLKIKDLTDLLNIKEKTLYEWIKEKKLPAYKINHQYYFNAGEIKAWVLEHNIPVSSGFLEITEGAPVNLPELVERGGVLYNIVGNTPAEAIKYAVNIMPIPPEVSKDMVTFSLIEREEMMPTAVGKGIAIPHPRNPIIADINHESVTICFLEKPVDFNAPDNIKVTAMFIILSANSKRHLQILSRISSLCRQNDFVELIKEKRRAELILHCIKQKEEAWKNK